MKNYIIQTERLGLRNWLPEDAESFIRLNKDKEVMEYFPNTFSEERTLKGIAFFTSQCDLKGYTFFAVDLLESDEFMGFIGLSYAEFEADFTPCTEIGWRLHKKFWNKGLATEGAKACLKHAFEKLNLSTIYSWTATLNKPSERVMQKIGMTFTGTFDHPKVEVGHALCKHVLYKIDFESWMTGA